MKVEDEFHRDMIEAADRCKREFGYNPTYWLRMIGDYGAVEAAKRLLRGLRASDGFTRLWEEGRLDLSVEFFVLLPQYAPRFTDEERAEARRRLELYEFDVDRRLHGREVPEGPAPPEELIEPRATRASSDAVEAPIVRPVVPPGAANTIWPTVSDLERARHLFGRHEPRDVFYRAATDLVEMALRGQSSVAVSEALAILLQTWNRAYYQYRKPDMVEHFGQLDEVLAKHQTWLAEVRNRHIDSFDTSDGERVRQVFEDFEAVLGPVGAAKALHLLAPQFLPLWDRAITVAYGIELGRAGTNGSRYLRFMRVVREQSVRLGGDAAVGRNVLKALDEYNYCRFSKGWLSP